MARFEQRLAYHGIAVSVPYADEVDVADEQFANKVLFCTFCQAKGLGRRVVFVLGFCNSYFKYYNKTADPT